MINHQCPFCDKEIILRPIGYQNEFKGACDHLLINWSCRYYIRGMDDKITETEFNFPYKGDYLNIIQYPSTNKLIIMKPPMVNDQFRIELPLFDIDYKDIPKLQKKISTYILLS